MRLQTTGWVKPAAALLLGLVAMLLLTSLSRHHVYVTHLTEKLPEISMRYEQLSGEMDEAALTGHFQETPLTCLNDPGVPKSLGDRVCYLSVDKVDGFPALTMVLFLRGGKLASAVVHVPWWRHGTAQSRLKDTHGSGVALSRMAFFQGPLLQWKLPRGEIYMNRDREVHPLAWSAVWWQPAQ